MLLNKIYFISFLAIFCFLKNTNVCAVSDQDKAYKEIWGGDGSTKSTKRIEVDNNAFDTVRHL
jgi:hypothetical protein